MIPLWQSPRPGLLILYLGEALSLGRRLLITEAAAQTGSAKHSPRTYAADLGAIG